MIYKGKHVNWTPHLNGMYGWHVIDVRGIFLAQVNVDGRWYAYDGTGRYGEKNRVDFGCAGNLEAAKAAAEKALLDAGILTLPSMTIYYDGKPVEWAKYENAAYGWYVIEVDDVMRYPACANTSGRWTAYDPCRHYTRLGEGEVGGLEEAKAAAVECLIKHGILTTAAPVKKARPVVSTYTFHFRADRGGATVVAAVVRGPTDTTVIYGVTFCSPKDSYDKNLGRRVAAYRLVAEPSSLSIPGDAAPREIKAAILDALDIPPGNRLVR